MLAKAGPLPAGWGKGHEPESDAFRAIFRGRDGYCGRNLRRPGLVSFVMSWKIAITRRAQIERVLALIALYSQPGERNRTRAGY